MPTDVAADIRQVLEDAGFNKVLSSDRWPEDEDGILVLGDPSPAPESTFATVGFTRHDIFFSCYVRHPKHGQARTTALAIRALLHELSPLPSATYISIVAQGQPIPIGRDEDGDPEFAVPFFARVEE